MSRHAAGRTDRPPPTRQTVLLWTILPATLAVAAFGGLSMAFHGLPLIALALVAAYVGFIWFSGHARLMRKVRAHATTEPAVVAPVRELCAAAGIPVPELFVSPDPSPNAFAITTSSGSAICVTRGLVNTLDQRELRGVLSHEIAHLRNRDSIFSLLFITVTNAITITMATLGFLVALALMSSNDNKRRNDDAGAMAAGLAVAALGLSVAKVLFAGASRIRERLADHDGAQLSGDALALATALEKIEHAAGRPIALPAGARAIAGFCIVNPGAGLLHTHPPTRRRVYWLRRLAAETGG